MAECQQLNSSLGVAASHRSFVSIASRCGGDVRLMTDGSMMTSSSRRRCGGGLGYRAHGGSSEDDDDDDCEGDVTSLNLANSGNGGVEISTPNGLWVTLNKTVLLQLVERICMLSFQQAETASTSSNQSQFYGRPATAERPDESGAEFAYSPSTTKQRSSPSAGTSKQSRNDKTCGTASPDLPETDVIECGVRPSVDAAAAATNGNGTMAAKQGRRSSSVSKVKQSHQSNSAAAPAPTTNACRDGADCTTAETVVDDNNKQHGGDAATDVVAGTETSSARESSRMSSEDQEMLPSESSVSDQKAIHTRSIRKRRLLKASVGQNIRVRTKNPDVDEKQLKRIETSGSDSSRSGAGSDDMSTAAETDMETAAAKENTATDTTANRLHDDDDDRRGLDVVNSRSSSSSTRRLRHSAAVAKLRRSQRCNRRRLQLIKQQLASGELPLRSDNGVGSGSGGGSRPPAAAWSSQQQQQQHQQQQQQLAESRRRQKQSWLALNKSIFYCALDRALTAGGNNDGGAGVEGNNARRASAPARANTTSTTRAAKSIWNPATSVSKYETAAASTAAEATSSQQQPPLFSPTGIQNPGSGVCQLLPVGMWSGSSDIASPSAAAVMVSPLWMAAAAASRNAFPFQPPSVAGAATTSAADYGLGSSCANSSLLCALLGFDVGQSVVAETTAALRLQQRQLPTEIPRGPPSTADDSDDVFMPPQPPPQQRQVSEKSDFDADARCSDRRHPPSVGDTPAVRAGSWTHSPPGWWNGNGRNDAEARGGRHSISGDVVEVTEDVHASQRRGDSRPNDESPLDCRTARLQQQQQQQQPVKAVIVPSNDGGKSELLRIAGGRVTDKWIVLDKCDVSSLVENLVNTMIVSTTSSSGPGGSASAEQRQLSPAAGSGSNQSSSAPASGTVAEPRKWKTNLLQRLQTETQIP